MHVGLVGAIVGGDGENHRNKGIFKKGTKVLVEKKKISEEARVSGEGIAWCEKVPILREGGTHIRTG